MSLQSVETIGGDQDQPAFAALVDSLPDPVMVVSARDAEDASDRRLVFANLAARELLRIQTAGGPLVSAIRHPEVLEAVDESLFGGLNGEAAYETGGAQDRFWRVRTRPLAPAADGARLALMVIRDETDSRRNERMRADFLANASHELRTPLASLTGFIETLRGHARDDANARERFLGVMASQAGRMARLIDDLLSLSRIELNEHIAPEGQVDVALVTLDVIAALAPLAAERGVRLQTRIAERGRAMITGDRDQMVQVAQNLIDNALKFSAPGGTVEIDVVDDVTADAALAPTRAWSAASGSSPCAAPTTAPASPASTCRACPSASIASRARRAESGWEPAWAWPSSSTSSTAIAAAWRSKASRARGRLSPSISRGCNKTVAKPSHSDSNRQATSFGVRF
jgi:two-component system phosphate regulon sensor histidine kinase PhoR